MRNLALRIKKLTSPEHFDSDMVKLKQSIARNGYPKAFIDEHCRLTDRERQSDQRHPVFLSMPFRGDAAAELFRRKLERSLKDNCREVRLIPTFTSRPLISVQSKDRLPVAATSDVVYLFTCSTCQQQYIGRTERRLEDRMKEHLPAWLSSEMMKTVRSSVTEHVAYEGHRCTKSDCFRILHKAQDRRLLNFTKATALTQFKLALNEQNEMDYQLRLSWS